MRDYAVEIPVALQADLLAEGWSGAVKPFPGQSSRDFSMTCLWNSILKKFQDNILPSADQRALDLFLEVNQSCAQFIWDPDQQSEIDAIAFGEARGFIHDFFFPDFSRGAFKAPILSYAEIFRSFGVGPGSNIGTRSNDFYSKIGTSVMTASSQSLLEKFKYLTRSEPLWSLVESKRSEIRGYQVIGESRLSFVPKTREISRTICTEPLCNMFFQKGIGSVIERRLREVCGIDLTFQPDNNRILAQRGSLDGKFGTIDLSSASDSMSLALVREFFPASVVRMLEEARTPFTILPDGRKVELHMVSSMGNAFTFPLQTLFFVSLVYGVYRARSIRPMRPSRQSLGNFAVFGDDIIVLREAYDHVCRLLMLCGFKVNVDKSFNDGFFRESCGSDFYQNHNVRGVYIRSLITLSDRYSAINRLNVWSAKQGVALPTLVGLLMRGTRFLRVPFHESDDAGIKVPLCLAKSRLDRFTGAVKYRCLTIEVRSFSMKDVQAQPPALSDWFENPDALMMAALAGTLRLGRVTPRVNRRLFRLKSKLTPHWEEGLGDRQSFPAGFGISWKVYTELNLNFS
jgi:hypothetical protein